MLKRDDAKEKENGTVIGFDFGMKRIGVAVGQNITRTATPLDTIAAKNGEPDWDQLTKLIEEWLPSALIVGRPLNMDGTEQAITQSTRHFVKRLKQRLHFPVFEIDERLTTIEARSQVFKAGGYKALKKRQIDSVAAKLIVECWYQQGHNMENT